MVHEVPKMDVNQKVIERQNIYIYTNIYEQ